MGHDMKPLAWRTAKKARRKSRRRGSDEQVVPLLERLKQLSDRAKRAAVELPPGKERESCLLKEVQAENVLELVRLLQR